LSGLGIGILLRSFVEKGVEKMPSAFTLAGLSSLVAGFVVASHAGVSHTWFQWPRPILLWIWFFYLGLILLALVFVHHFLFNYNGFPRLLKLGLQALATLGILAFPVYVLQGFIFPLRSILVMTLGIPSFPAILGVIGLFLGILSLISRKIHSANFGN
jgi:hypothetical protein